METYIQVNGDTIRNKGLEKWIFLMVQCMKENGKIIKFMERGK
jgi:hypothetical protein